MATNPTNEDLAAAAEAVHALNEAKRSTNSSQVSSRSGLNRTAAQAALQVLKGRGYITDVGKGAAYNWRMTDKGRIWLGVQETVDTSQKPRLTQPSPGRILWVCAHRTDGMCEHCTARWSITEEKA